MLDMVNKQLNNYEQFSNLTELGKYLNISRQTASNRIKANGWTGRLSFSEKELNALKSQKKKGAKVKSNNEQIVSVLSKQVADQQETIKSLNEQLINSQKLQLISQQENQTLLNQLNDMKSIEQKKPSFWQRIFG